MNRREALQAMGVLSVAPLVGRPPSQTKSQRPLPVGSLFESPDGYLYWRTTGWGGDWRLVQEDVPIPSVCVVKLGEAVVRRYRLGRGGITCCLGRADGKSMRENHKWCRCRERIESTPNWSRETTFGVCPKGG